MTVHPAITRIAKTLFDSAILLVLASIIVFMLVRVIPGDPASAMAGPTATLEEIEAIRASLKLNDPIWVQYMVWVGSVLSGDLGQSFTVHLPVLELIQMRIGSTIELTIAGVLAAIILGLITGVISGLWRNKLPDSLASGVSIISHALPSFWIGMILLVVFGLILRWSPISGYVPVTEDFATGLWHLVFPAVTLGLANGPKLFWYLRGGVVENLREDHVRTAIMKGLPTRSVVGNHVLRNSLIPTFTFLGVLVGKSLGGAVVVEVVFNRPGLGRLLVDSVLNRDYPTVQGVVLLAVAIFIAVNSITDLLYTWVDPRLRLEAAP
jgi:peptide/nickel transport system permease protein